MRATVTHAILLDHHRADCATEDSDTSYEIAGRERRDGEVPRSCGLGLSGMPCSNVVRLVSSLEDITQAVVLGPDRCAESPYRSCSQKKASKSMQCYTVQGN